MANRWLKISTSPTTPAVSGGVDQWTAEDLFRDHDQPAFACLQAVPRRSQTPGRACTQRTGGHGVPSCRSSTPSASARNW